MYSRATHENRFLSLARRMQKLGWMRLSTVPPNYLTAGTANSEESYC